MAAGDGISGSLGSKTIATVGLSAFAAVATVALNTWFPHVSEYLIDRFSADRVVYIFVLRNDGSNAPLENVAVSAVDLSAAEPRVIEETRTNKDGLAALKHIQAKIFMLKAHYTDNDYQFSLIQQVKVENYPYTVTIDKDVWMKQQTGATAAVLAPPPQLQPAAAAGAGNPRWLTVAMGEFGVKESPPPASTARIEEYHAATSIGRNPQTVPWGCSFVSWTLQQAHVADAPHTALCRDFLNYGAELKDPRVGALAVLNKAADPEANTAKVGVVLSSDDEGVTLLIGNVENSVTVRRYSKSLVMAYRWPNDSAAK